MALDPLAAFGSRLRALREERNLSQEKLADRAGVSLTTVARLERQRSPSCRCRTLARLAAALGEHPATIACTPRATPARGPRAAGPSG